ncbi:MAG: 50S ribosomal protein L13 [Candidatus Syntropharchaeia archaeon]
MKVFDVEGQILGRVCTRIAKELLKGEDVVVVNCEKAVISGNPKSVIEEYMERRRRGDPIHGPFFPRTPEGIFRRAVRGMLPWKKAKGREAMKRLKVFVGVPKKYENEEKIKVEGASSSKLRTKYITIEELSLSLGAKKRW